MNAEALLGNGKEAGLDRSAEKSKYMFFSHMVQIKLISYTISDLSKFSIV